MEREVGVGIGMGKTCKLKDVSFQFMKKFTKKKKKNNFSVRMNTQCVRFQPSEGMDFSLVRAWN